MRSAPRAGLPTAALATYLRTLGRIEAGSLGRGSTSSAQLDAAGRKLLGRGFLGAFAYDAAPIHSMRDGNSMIINQDRYGGPGIHWMAIAHDRGDNLFYDSFGRNEKEVLPARWIAGAGDLIDAEGDAEQRRREENCGQRSLAWLVAWKRHGRGALTI